MPRRRHSRQAIGTRGVARSSIECEVIVTVGCGRGYTDAVTPRPTPRRRAGITVVVVLLVAAALTLLLLLERGWISRHWPGAGGNAGRGAPLFARLACASCHDVDHPWPGGEVCPNLGNIATEAGRIVRRADYHGHATDAAGYIRESIVDPNAYVVPGAAYRQADGQSVMPKDFSRTLSAADLDDLVAFLLTRR
jgi:cytochrome c551/c552